RGSMRLLPRGGWREGVGSLARADVVVVTHKAAAHEAVRQIEGLAAERVGQERVVRCRIAPAGLLPLAGAGAADAIPSPQGLGGRKVLAVTSLADPRPFVAHLSEEGAQVELAAFPDHHDFTAAEADALRARAGTRPILMTRKEAVKLRELLPPDMEAWMLEQKVVIENNGEALDQALRSAVGE